MTILPSAIVRAPPLLVGWWMAPLPVSKHSPRVLQSLLVAALPLPSLPSPFLPRGAVQGSFTKCLHTPLSSREKNFARKEWDAASLQELETR